MASELRRFQDGKPLTIRRPSLLEKFGYWARANRQVVASLAAIGLVIFLAAIVTAVIARQEQAETRQALVLVQEQRDEATRLYLQADGSRLAATSILQAETDPELALMLAIEAAQRDRGSDAHDAIMRAIDVGREPKDLLGHDPKAGIGHLAFDARGTRLVSSATGQTLLLEAATNLIEPAIVWNTATGQAIGKLNGNRTITSAAFSPSDNIILTASSLDLAGPFRQRDGMPPPGAPILWNAASLERLVTFDEAHLFRADRRAFSPDSLKVVLPSGANGAAIYFCTGEKLVELTGHEARVVFAAFNAQGDRVVTTADDQTVRIWDAASGMELIKISIPPNRLTWVEFSSDGSRLVTGSPDRGIELWDLQQQGNRIRSQRVPGSEGMYFRHGDLMATFGGEDESTLSRLTLRDAGDLSQKGELRLNQFIHRLAIGPDHSHVAFVPMDFLPSFELWNLDRREYLATCSLGADPFNAIAFSPDSKWIATAGMRGRVRLWHVADGRDRATFPTSTFSGFPPAASSPDGQLLSIVGTDQRPVSQFCDFNGANPTLILNGQLATSSWGGERFLLAGDGRLAVHSMSDGGPVGWETPLHMNPLAIAIDQSGDRAAAFMGESDVLLWSTATGRRLLLPVGQTRVNDLAFQPDGKRLFAVSSDGMIRIWAAESGQMMESLDHGAQLSDILFSQDGKRFAVTHRNGVTVYDAESLQQTRRLETPRLASPQIKFSFDGNKLVTFGNATPESIVVWDIESGGKDATLEAAGQIGIAMHPSQPEMMVWSSEQNTKIWRYEDDQQIELPESANISGAYSSDGQTFYLGSGTVVSEHTALDQVPERLPLPKLTRWNRETNQLQQTIEFPSQTVSEILVGEQGQVIVRGTRFHAIDTYERGSRQRLSVIAGHVAPISACRYPSDSQRLITTSWDGFIAIWNVSSGQALGRWNHGSPIFSAAISQDDQYLVTGARDGTVRVWSLNVAPTETPNPKANEISQSPIRHVAWSPDANRVLVISNDHQAHLMDRDSGNRLPFDFQTEAVEWAEFAPDGQSVLVIPFSSDIENPSKEVLLIPINGGKVIRLEYPIAVSTAHYSPDSKRIVTTTRSKEESIAWIQIIESQQIDHKLVFDATACQYAVFDPTGEFVYVSEFRGGSIWRVTDGRKWMTLEDANVADRWRHLMNPFAVGKPSQIITRRFETKQYRHWPLDPLEAAKQFPLRPLTENERSRFRIQALDAEPARLE